MTTANYEQIYGTISSIVKENNGMPDRYFAAGHYNRRLVEEIVDAALLLDPRTNKNDAEPEYDEEVLDSIEIARELIFGLEQLHEKLLERERKAR